MNYTITILDRNGKQDVFGCYPKKVVKNINDVVNTDDIVKVVFGNFDTWEDADKFKSKYPKYMAMNSVHCGGSQIWLTFNSHNREGTVNKLTVKRRKKIVEILKSLQNENRTIQ